MTVVTSADQAQVPVPDVRELPFEVGGVALTMRVYPDPSGLRGQVFRGEEKLAGVQIFHTTDIDRLFARAASDRAVLRAVARFSSGG